VADFHNLRVGRKYIDNATPAHKATVQGGVAPDDDGWSYGNGGRRSRRDPRAMGAEWRGTAEKEIGDVEIDEFYPRAGGKKGREELK
jgi:hypothetical protein